MLRFRSTAGGEAAVIAQCVDYPIFNNAARGFGLAWPLRNHAERLALLATFALGFGFGHLLRPCSEVDIGCPISDILQGGEWFVRMDWVDRIVWWVCMVRGV